VPGVELAQAALDERSRAALARPLGAFLRALHSADIDVELPTDPIKRTDMPYRVGLARERLAALGRTPAGAEEILADALELPPPDLTALVHGDLHLRHALDAGAARARRAPADDRARVAGRARADGPAVTRSHRNPFT
jgi:aminoglycoside phosphotransferase (APT) family kinase protein